MADRKEWELTDEEIEAAWLSETQDQSDRAIATAAARKALEWAAKNCMELTDG